MAIKVQEIKKSNAQSHKMWQVQYDVMDVHLNAEPPKEILKNRRPNESEDKEILKYRLSNLRHTLKSLFDRALDITIEILQKSNIDYTTSSKRLRDFMDTYRIYSSGNYFSLKEWLFGDVVRFSELDANASFVVLPRPENPLQPTFGEKIPVFTTGKPIAGVDIILVESKDIVINSEDLFIFKAGMWTWKKEEKSKKAENEEPEYKELKEPYYYIYTKNQLDLYIPVEKNKKVAYETKPYYLTDLNYIPVKILGNRYVLQYNPDDKPESRTKHKIFVSNFFSAALLGDLYYGQVSDTQLISTKYFPIRYQVKTDCDAGCTENLDDHIYYDDQGGVCKSCKGKGKIIDFGVSDIYLLDKPTQFDEGTADLKSPIGYASPPAELLSIRNDIDQELYEKIEKELCLNQQQNMTNAKEGKQIDKDYKITFYSNIVEAKLGWFESLLIYSEQMLEFTQSVTTKVIRPKKWDIRSKEELLAEITDMKKNNAPEIMVRDAMKELLRAQYGHDDRSQRIVDFIMLKDKLITYGGGDLATARSLYGNSITQLHIDIHNLIYQVMDIVLLKNPKLDLSDFAKVNEQFDKELQPFLTVVANPIA